MAGDVLLLVVVAVAAVLLVVVMRSRRRSHGQFLHQYATEEVCEHLRPALDLLLSRQHIVQRAGQHHADLPLEIHIEPPFDPQAVYDELKLQPPVFVSERKVLYCREDWCELHPRK